MDRRRIPPILVDTVLAMLLFALGLISREELIGSAIGEVYTREPDAWNTLLIALQTLPLALRRRYPVEVLVTALLAFAADRALDYPNTLAGAGFVVAIHAVGSELPRRRSAAIGFSIVAGMTVFTTIGSILFDSVSLDDVVVTFLATLVPLVLGREVHQRRLLFRELEERADRAERDREERARQAVADERARIARELHDVVAHQMAVMTVQAEGAGRIARNGDPRVREALSVITQAGHEGLTEMRRVVGLLRTEPAKGEDLEPQPGLADLDRLVSQMRDSGLEVEVQTEGSPRPLPGGVDLNAFRIVQESLTNALKHGGPGVRAAVLVRYGDERIDIRVTDDGRGAAANGDGPGHGLVGMRERVTMLEGEFHAAPRPGGGYEVSASLPVTA